MLMPLNERSSHLHVLLADGQLARVGEVHEEGEGEGVHAVDGNLSLARLRHVVCEVERGNEKLSGYSAASAHH